MIVVPAECAKDFDHIGHGATGLLADNDEQGQVHNGADDNAPGTAVVLHLAERHPKRETRHRGIVFTLWSGEKLGLVGSSRFVADPPHYLGMAHIAAFREERPDYVRVENAGSGQRDHDSLCIYIGTIPDYATDAVGVKLSGVRGGDVIVEFGGQAIANIYDCTFALDAVRIGEAVQVVVLRDGERLGFSATPQARE